MSIPNPYAEQGVIIPTTSTTTCVPTYVSVTINAGNSFVIPPGASLVAVSDTNLVQSDCVDVNALEQKQCYMFKISGACNDLQADSENWEPQNTYISGYYIDSTKYSPTSTDLNLGFTTEPCPQTSVVIGNFETSLEETSLNGIIEFIQLDNDADNCNCQGLVGGDRGWTINIIFKTIPSVANSLMMELRTPTSDQDQANPAITYVLVKPIAITCPEI